MTWVTDEATTKTVWVDGVKAYCYCCKAKVGHCFCSFHQPSDGGCGMCMTHNAVEVEEKVKLADGTTLVRKVMEHVCPK